MIKGQSPDVKNLFVEILETGHEEGVVEAFMQFKLENIELISSIEISLSTSPDFSDSHKVQFELFNKSIDNYYFKSGRNNFHVFQGFVNIPVRIPDHLIKKCKFFKIQIINLDGLFTEKMIFNINN